MTAAYGSRRAAVGPCKASGFSVAAPWLLRRTGEARQGEHGRGREPGCSRPLHGSSSPSGKILLQASPPDSISPPSVLQNEVNLLNPLAELEKQAQEEASRAVHQLILMSSAKTASTYNLAVKVLHRISLDLLSCFHDHTSNRGD
ncbi:uncharacterized protein [Aegilops tauschii subsp. strangulata]|uniref:uncharacterized protein isoform X1 n=1 Tax=Aegilops tauschii subsp. strangulata TaxID=200361 RepID=UPI000989E39C|nr:uncharacterized protein LOC109775074 isoform X2 [Aegilops tauschii subsp. strangulata]